MGRWAARRRRSSAALPRTTPPPSLISAVDDGAGFITLTFDRNVTCNPAGAPEFVSLELDFFADTVNTAAQAGSSSIQINQDIDPSAGTTLTWLNQPAWIVETIDLSTSTPVT